jgi:hypothetical protein
LSLITSEECVESNIITVEAMKFLEEEVQIETLDNAATTNEQDGEDEDLVCRNIFFNKNFLFLISIYFSLILFKLKLHTNTHKQHNCIIYLDI